MTTPTGPLHVVVAGGGVAAAESVLALRDLAGERVRLTLVTPDRNFELKALRTAEAFAVEHVPPRAVSELAARAQAELVGGTLAEVMADRRAVRLTDGAELGYDALIVAVGARPRAWSPGAVTFGIDRRTDALRDLLVELEQRRAESVALVVPPGLTWPLPLYEIALMLAGQARRMGADEARLELVTPEHAPLALFGPRASAAVGGLLAAAGVGFRGSFGGGPVEADRVVTMPILEGPGVPGLPADAAGFHPIDDTGRVRGVVDVYAAGDNADFPIKQGGLACQQADAIAEHLAARAGATVVPAPFRPVLRGQLLTGRGAHYLRNGLDGDGEDGGARELRLWFPPTKVSGRYLSSWLADGVSAPSAPSLDIEVPLPAPADGAAALDPYETAVQLRAVTRDRRRLLADLVTAQETERGRIAAEIHDDSIQVISAAALQLDALARRLDDDHARDDVRTVARTLGDATGRLRRLMFDMRPRRLEREGLAEAIRAYVRETQSEAGERWRVVDQLDGATADSDTTIVLYRIAQEAVRNVRKHACCAAFDVLVERRDGGVALQVHDEGVGCDVEQALAERPGHLGLVSIRERAEMAGGWMALDSEAGRGTTLRAWIPDAR